MCPQFSIKDSVLLLLKKKQRKKTRFSAKSLVENFYRLKIKDFRLTILWDLHDLELAKVKNVSPKTVELIF